MRMSLRKIRNRTFKDLKHIIKGYNILLEEDCCIEDAVKLYLVIDEALEYYLDAIEVMNKELERVEAIKISYLNFIARMYLHNYKALRSDTIMVVEEIQGINDMVMGHIVGRIKEKSPITNEDVIQQVVVGFINEAKIELDKQRLERRVN